MKEDKELIVKIRAREWTMGNGQCHECCGTKDGFNGHSLSYNKFDMGHEKGCSIGEILEAFGEEVLWKRESKCISVVCSKCGADLMQEGSIKNYFECSNCGNDLLFGTKREFEEIKELIEE